MPCDIGFKSYAKIEIPAPQPQTFTTKSEAPQIDADLLEKLGEEDPEFLEWAKEIDSKPLLEEALKRALQKLDKGDIDFRLDYRGMLEAKGRFISAREKQVLSEKASAVSNRWQFEILGIVAELLDYRVTITENGEELIVEAERNGETHPCDYIKITKRGNASALVFEHFKSRRALTLETAKFLALADRLGIKIAMETNKVSEGDPFPGTEQLLTGHRHGNKTKK